MIKNIFSHAGKLKPKSTLGKLAAITLILVVLVGAGVAGFNWYTNHVWPDFPATQADNQTDPAAPQAIVSLKRDYAYRTADLVKLKLYLRQMPGTTIDVQTLSLADTFELADKPVVTQRQLKDGSIVYRIELTLQSFKVAPDLTFAGSVGWRNGSQRSDMTLPETHVYTSNTYDGRKNLQEGDDPRVTIYWYATRYVAPMVIALIIYVLLLVPAVRLWLRSLIKPVVVDKARRRAVELLEKVKASGCDKDEHLELDSLVRLRFKLGPVPARQLELAIVPPSIIDFLKLNEPAIYSPDALDDYGRGQLFTKGQLMLHYWK